MKGARKKKKNTFIQKEERKVEGPEVNRQNSQPVISPVMIIMGRTVLWVARLAAKKAL